MNNSWLKKALPHVLAILVFLIVSVLFCKPVLDGKTLDQHDTGIVGWKGSAQNAFEVKEKTGSLPLWSTSVFSGMPNYQIAMEGQSAIPVDLNKVMALGLPKPMNFFFIACVCFYILCVVLRAHPVLGAFGALAFAFSTYNPLIISGGHETKMMAIAYMPLLLAGLLLIYMKRYWIGLAVATLGAMFELMSNHPQISYYFFLVAAAVTVGYAVIWIKNKEFRHMLTALGLSCIAALTGLGCYALAFSSTNEYTKYTMRGGKSVEISGNEVKTANTKGLDADYAMQYSMNKVEPLVMLMPRAVGGSTGTPSEEDSKVVSKLAEAGVPEMQAAQFVSQLQLPAYWGGMSSQGEYSGGPAYIGAIIFILAIIGFVVVRGPVKWALLVVTVLSVLMSWGKYFLGFNEFLLNNLPLYNKFRAPSMALVIAGFTMPLMAVFATYTLFFAKDAKATLQANFKNILYTLGGMTVILGILYIGQGYTSVFDTEVVMKMPLDPSGGDTLNRAIVAGLKEDRQSLFGSQVLRSVVFMAVVLGACYACLKNWLKPAVAVALLALITLADLWVIDKKYFPDEQYVPKDEVLVAAAQPSDIDQQILKDKDPHFRVYDVAGLNSNRVSYFHRSARGYHPAKLRIYQDVIERYFNDVPNNQVLNALDVRYIIMANEQGQQQLIPNPQAYGAAWFVKAVKPAADDAEALQAIGATNLKDTAVVSQSVASGVTAVADSSSTITLEKYTNDEITYTTNSGSGGFVVFSEVYYPAGWKVYVDDKQAEIVRTNYFMRGLGVPKGKHTIKMVFEPDVVTRGMKISYLSSWLVIIIVLAGFAMQWWVNRKGNKGTEE